MQYHISTGLIVKHFEQNCGCPLCSIEKIVENNVCRELLADGCMDDDVRTIINAKGFCEKHFDLLFSMPSKLGLALQSDTRLKTLKKHLLTKPLSAQKAKKQAKKITEARITCAVCDYTEEEMVKYYKTIAQMYTHESEWREKLLNCDGFCLKHYAKLLEYSNYSFLKAKDYLVNNGLTLTYTDASLSLSCQPILNDNIYEITFKEIGTTTIPVDLTNYNSKTSWANEDEELAQAIIELLGSLDILPYFDTGHGWNYFDYSADDYLEICSEGDEAIGGMPEEEAAQLKLEYAQILKDVGYRKMTSEEIENLSFYYCEDPDAQQVYDLGNGFACEVYDSYADSWGMGIGLYIQKIEL